MFWSLAKVVDEADGGISLQGIFDAENIDVALVEKMMKYIYSLHRGWSLLFVAKNSVKKLDLHTNPDQRLRKLLMNLLTNRSRDAGLRTHGRIRELRDECE